MRHQRPTWSASVQRQLQHAAVVSHGAPTMTVTGPFDLGRHPRCAHCKEDALGMDSGNDSLGIRRVVWEIRVGIIKMLEMFQRQYFRKGTKKLMNMMLVPGSLSHPEAKVQKASGENVGKNKVASFGVFSDVENVKLQHEFAFSASQEVMLGKWMRICAKLGKTGV